MPPPVEHACHELAVFQDSHELVLLVAGLDGFECLLVPLLDCYPHFEVTESFKYVHESLESHVALLVKATVSKELVDGVLLAGQLHNLQHLEQTFCDE